MFWNWKVRPPDLGLLFKGSVRHCQLVLLLKMSMCCVALHLHRQLYGEQILLLVLFWWCFPPHHKLVFSQIRLTSSSLCGRIKVCAGMYQQMVFGRTSC